jgi:hypothetical protein
MEIAGNTVTVHLAPPVAGWARPTRTCLSPLGFALQGLDEGVALRGPSDAPGNCG